MPNQRIAIAEAIGTFILILGGPGTAILATGTFFPDGSVGVLGVALAFGLSLLIAAYAVGPISGCHINPAVTFGMWLAGRTGTAELPAYIVGQVVGALAGGLLLFIVTGTIDGFDADPATFAVNGWGDLSPGGFGFWAMALVEIVLTAVLVFNVISTTRREYSTAIGGLHVGLTLALIHLISIPVDNTSVNPVRSLSVAVFAGGDALEQLWAFFVFPLIGGAVGWLAHRALEDDAEVPDEDLAPA
jgi:aquaporin Z